MGIFLGSTAIVSTFVGTNTVSLQLGSTLLDSYSLANYKLNDTLPLAVADFVSKRYFDPESTTLDALLSPTRSGLATMIDSTGMVCWNRHNMWKNRAFAGAVSGTPGTGPTNITSGAVGGVTTTFGTGSVRIVAVAGRYQLTHSVAVAAYSETTLEVDVEAVDGALNYRQIATIQSLPADAAIAFYKDDVLVLATDIAPTSGSYNLKVVLTCAATAGSPTFWVGLGILSTSTGDLTLSNVRIYESRLPMANEDTLGTLVETTGAAIYKARIGHYGPLHQAYWLGDSFLGNNILPVSFARLVSQYEHFGYIRDGVGGSSLAAQAVRFADAIAADATVADRTLIIMDGGLTDTAEAAITAIDDMVSRLTHDRWLFIQSTPFYENNGDGIQEKWAALETHVGAEHWVSTYEEAQAANDGSPEDLAEIARGLWPLSLKSSASDQHPNQDGKDLLAELAYAKALSNGYLDLRNLGARIDLSPVTNLLTQTYFTSSLPTSWTASGAGTRELTTLYGVPAIRFVAEDNRPALYHSAVTLEATTTYTMSARVAVIGSPTTQPIIAARNFTGATGDIEAGVDDIDGEGYVQFTFTTGADAVGDFRFGAGINANTTAEMIFSELQVVEGTERLPWVPTAAATLSAAADDPNFTMDAGTYDVRIITDEGTTDLDGVVHGGGDYWPTEADDNVARVTIYPDETF